MIKAIFSFFQIPIEAMLEYAIRYREPAFCKAPKKLKTVDVPFAVRHSQLHLRHD